jgi:phosphate transport system protein
MIFNWFLCNLFSHEQTTSGKTMPTILRTIRKLISGHDTLGDLRDQLDEMLKIAESMFYSATSLLTGKSGESEESLKAQDHKINELEAQIRRKVMTHLTVSPDSGELNAFLLFVSVAQDAERLGDFCKNIQDVLLINPGVAQCKNCETLANVQQRLAERFEAVRKAVREDDPELAEKAVGESKKDTRVCGQAISEMLAYAQENDGQNGPYSVASVLLLRYCRRMFSHLSHIAGSVFLPMDSIDKSPKLHTS